MTRNQIAALQLQEDQRHNRVSEVTDAITGGLGNIGSLLKGIGSFKGSFGRKSSYRGHRSRD